MGRIPIPDIRSGIPPDQKQQAARVVSRLPGQTMTLFAKDHSVTAAMDAQELERLTAKHGEAHPRVRQKAKAVELNAQLATVLGREADRLDKLALEPDPHRLIVHGHVGDATGRPTAGVRAELLDRRSGRVLGRASTDDAGYFRIDGQAAASRDEGSREAGEPELLLSTGQNRHVAERRIKGGAGDVRYVDIILD
jgi:hypothetical protein